MTNQAVLISGGIDSTALAFWMTPKYGFVVDYGQLSAEAEITASEKICQILGVDLEIVRVNCRRLGFGTMSGGKEIKSSPSPEWWPFRNQLLATLVAPRALEKGIESLLFASVKTDDFHVDGRLEFFQILDRVMSLQEGNLTVSAPAIDLSTVELVQKSRITFDILGWTHSCHVGNFACGRCRGCVKHQGVFRELGIEETI